MPSADAVIIGGGVNGTSTAFHLASLGVRKINLVERRQLAAGATGKSGSLVRMHYTNEPESRLAWESLKVFRDFKVIVGGDCGFEPAGFLQIVPRGHEAALGRNVSASSGSASTLASSPGTRSGGSCPRPSSTTSGRRPMSRAQAAPIPMRRRSHLPKRPGASERPS